MIWPFAKKDKSEFGDKLSELKKIIFKSDDTSVTDSIILIGELNKLNASKLSETIIDETANHGSDFVYGMISKLLVMEDEPFSDSLLQAMLDHSFRYGGKDEQRSAVLLLRKYKSHTELLARYKLVYVKDKKSQKMLADLY